MKRKFIICLLCCFCLIGCSSEDGNLVKTTEKVENNTEVSTEYTTELVISENSTKIDYAIIDNIQINYNGDTLDCKNNVSEHTFCGRIADKDDNDISSFTIAAYPMKSYMQQVKEVMTKGKAYYDANEDLYYKIKHADKDVYFIVYPNKNLLVVDCENDKEHLYDNVSFTLVSKDEKEAFLRFCATTDEYDKFMREEYLTQEQYKYFKEQQIRNQEDLADNEVLIEHLKVGED